MLTVGAIIDRPQTTAKHKNRAIRESPLQSNFSRKLVFSAALCYNELNEKPSSGRKGNALSLSRLRRQLPPGGSLWIRSCNLRGMGFALCLCNTKAKLAINRFKFMIGDIYDENQYFGFYAISNSGKFEKHKLQQISMETQSRKIDIYSFCNAIHYRVYWLKKHISYASRRNYFHFIHIVRL